MGKVQTAFGNGCPGAVSRAVDDIILSVRNGSAGDIPFGAPVFLNGGDAVPFDPASPQDFSAFLGFAVRVADKTPDSYPSGQFGQVSDGAWKAGDVMEVLVRGSVILPVAVPGQPGQTVYIRKADGKLTTQAGSGDSTVALENVRVRRPGTDAWNTCEAVVNKRNLL